MDKKYIIGNKTEWFYDGHGTPEKGSEWLFTAHTDKYNNLDPEKAYNTELEEFEDDEDLYSKDGYNCTETVIKFKFIDEYEYNYARNLISDYNNLSVIYGL